MSECDARLPGDRRLKQRGQFRALLARRPVSADRLFKIYAAGNSGPMARLGLTVSRRAARRAVDRNQIKRLIREFFRHHQWGVGSYDILVVAKPAVAGHTNKIIHQSLEYNWLRIAQRCVDSVPR